MGERLHNAQRHVNSAREQSQKLQTQLQEVMAHCIKTIAEHAEKEEKRKKASEEMFAEDVPKESKTNDDEKTAQEAN